jgi:hypothetical protein
MTTGDRHIGSDSQHRLSDQVSANTTYPTHSDGAVFHAAIERSWPAFAGAIDAGGARGFATGVVLDL